MPKEIEKLDTELFSNCPPQQALAFAERFNVVGGYHEVIKYYAGWVEDLRTGWYQQRKYLKLGNGAFT
jgi:hypothetical protein